MKKLIALVLSLTLLLACAAASAEGGKESMGVIKVQKAFDIRFSPLPDGYTLSIEEQNEMQIIAVIESSRKDLPKMRLAISFYEPWANTERLNDVSEEDIQAIKDSFLVEYPELEFGFRDTNAGTKLLTVQAPSGLEAYIFTIYKGHEIEIQITVGPEQEKLTDADIDRVVAFLSDVDFVPVNE